MAPPNPVGVTFPQQQPPFAEAPGARLGRLRAVLTQVDAESGDAHVPVLVAALAVGAVAIPTGAVMLSRDRADEATSIGGAVILGTGIGSVLGGVIQLFLPLGATMELGDELARAESTGAPADHVVTMVEQRWAQVAADARLGRKVGGGFSMGLGAVALGAGTAVALAEPAALSTTDQAILSSALVFGGAMSLVGGLQVFFTELPQEVAWNTYAASNGLPREPLIVAPRFGIAPTRGGAVASFDARF
jgi:hypothetical protein